MLNKTLRTVQSHFPALYEAKNWLYDRRMDWTLRPGDPDFLHLDLLPRVEGEIFLDIGANRGQSIHAMRLLRPEARIVAFEPQAAMVNRLKRRTHRDTALRLEHCGLGAAETTATLYTPVYRGCAYDGLASFDRAAAAEWLNAERVFLFDPALQVLREETCRIRPLDAFDLAPAFIKMDVQGTEAAVIAGAEQTLLRHQPLVLLERGPDSGEALAALGYVEVMPGVGGFSPGTRGGMNAFFMHTSRLHY